MAVDGQGFTSIASCDRGITEKRVKEEFDKIHIRRLTVGSSGMWRNMKGKWIGNVKIHKPTAVKAISLFVMKSI